MATKHLLTRGIGMGGDAVYFIPRRGLTSARSRLHPHLKPYNPAAIQVKSDDPRARRRGMATSQDHSFTIIGDIVQIEDDYLLCTIVGTSNKAKVAKPPRLRGGDGVVDIDPPYLVGDSLIITIPVGGTGLSGVTFQDMNIDARQGTALTGGGSGADIHGPAGESSGAGMNYKSTYGASADGEISTDSWALDGTDSPVTFYEALNDFLAANDAKYIKHTNASSGDLVLSFGNVPGDFTIGVAAKFTYTGQDPVAAGPVEFCIVSGGGVEMTETVELTFGATWSTEISAIALVLPGVSQNAAAWNGARVRIRNPVGAAGEVDITYGFVTVYYG